MQVIKVLAWTLCLSAVAKGESNSNIEDQPNEYHEPLPGTSLRKDLRTLVRNRRSLHDDQYNNPCGGYVVEDHDTSERRRRAVNEPGSSSSKMLDKTIEFGMKDGMKSLGLPGLPAFTDHRLIRSLPGDSARQDEIILQELAGFSRNDLDANSERRPKRFFPGERISRPWRGANAELQSEDRKDLRGLPGLPAFPIDLARNRRSAGFEREYEVGKAQAAKELANLVGPPAWHKD